MVRSRADGSTELLTKRKGTIYHYLVDANGEDQLVTTHPPPDDYAKIFALGALGIGLFFGGIITSLIVGGGGWAVGGIALGTGIGWVAKKLSPHPRDYVPAGEEWQQIGDLSNI
jgi:hypothetical protein